MRESWPVFREYWQYCNRNPTLFLPNHQHSERARHHGMALLAFGWRLEIRCRQIELSGLRIQRRGAGAVRRWNGGDDSRHSRCFADNGDAAGAAGDEEQLALGIENRAVRPLADGE